MKHRMQIMQELWEYNLTTNSVKFMQLSEGVTIMSTTVYLTDK